MLALIERGIVGIFRAAKEAGQLANIKSIDSYAGQLDEDLGEVTRAYPAIWVTWGGSGKPVAYDTSKRKYLVPATFVVMYATRNLNSEKAARQGTVREIGNYELLSIGRTLLLRNDLSLAGVDAFEPGPERVIYNTRVRNNGLSVIAQEWTTKYVITKPDEDEGAPDLLRIRADYHLAPDDGEADLQDVIELRT